MNLPPCDETALDAIDLALLATAAHYDLRSKEDRQRSCAELRALFLRLHELHPTENILEIGANEASFARAVRKRAPAARIFAFEANPHNYERFSKRPVFADLGIQYLHLAIADKDGSMPFNVQLTRDGKPVSPNTGSNSLLSRVAAGEVEVVDVPTTTVASFALSRGLEGEFSAWIDVEGANAMVLAGMETLLPRFRYIHCEVEDRVQWRGQWIWRDVLAFLGARGFTPIARDFEYTGQFNVVFVRRDLLRAQAVRLALAMHHSTAARALAHTTPPSAEAGEAVRPQD